MIICLVKLMLMSVCMDSLCQQHVVLMGVKWFLFKVSVGSPFGSVTGLYPVIEYSSNSMYVRSVLAICKVAVRRC
jgi:hypothetical protein